jgi:hypothetical protein
MKGSESAILPPGGAGMGQNREERCSQFGVTRPPVVAVGGQHQGRTGGMLMLCDGFTVHCQPGFDQRFRRVRPCCVRA